MQKVAWKNEAFRAVAISTTGLLLGWSAGYPSLGLIGGLLATVIFMFISMLNFYRWALHKHIAPEAGLLGYSTDILLRNEKALLQKITEQQRMLKRHFQGIDSLHDGVVILEESGHILHFNRAAQQLLNLRLEDKGQLITNLIRNPRFKEYLQESNSSEFVQIDLRHKQHYFLQIQVTGFGSQQKLLLVQNITERKKIETMRKSFIANASHELRTPLTVINGYLEIFEDIEDAAQQKQIIGKIQQQSSRMKELIDDLLHLSKLETDTPHTYGEWFDLKHLAYTAVGQLPETDQARIQVSCPHEIDVLGFVGEMHTIITNLLTNALKYGGKKDIQFTIEASFNGVTLSVVDQGAGIANEHIAHLTERFYRVNDSQYDNIKGSGLGLAIVKHALELHGSKLNIRSELGQGSTFSFVLHPERCRFHR